ncbi:type IV secretion system DNA-binding domain-containing protein [Candidatus Peregrinibacteria bacterium]|jgi:hypothetical protein|nr:type IV secretion system DNA-binding domain-containing protein [Candidatus Peregrinibacteria bacterium]MBT4056387.1 type IV secretion system DNA-binding domain-containing protein [Candidatus Peregrinibacteria bacterium]
MSLWLTILLSVGGALLTASILVKLFRYQMNLRRSLDMVFLEVRVPKKESKEDREVEGERYSTQKDFKEISGVMTHFYESLHSLYQERWYRVLKSQDFFSFEYAVLDAQVRFFIVCPRDLVDHIEKQLTAFYPDAYVETTDDYNIFQPEGKVAGHNLYLAKHHYMPIKTYQRLTSDPLNSVVNSLSKIQKDEGAAIQIMVRPRKDGWQKKGRKIAEKKFHNKSTTDFKIYNPITWFRTLFDLLFSGERGLLNKDNDGVQRTTPVTDDEVKAMEEKNSKPGFEVLVRVLASAPTKRRATEAALAIKNSFAQYSFSNNNNFRTSYWHSNKTLIKNFIFRHFRRNLLTLLLFRKNVLCSEELASIYHLPNIRFNSASNIAWQNYKISAAPANLPSEGLLIGHNVNRGEKKEVRIKNEDRFRHFYVIGQTGTGKSSVLQVMIRQDLKEGKGLCVIDPHGSLVEDILPFIPRERADDVIYFNPSDMDRPLGINLLEGDTWEEKELVALEAMNIMIKLFNEEVFGPRIQDYFRNGCLTLMSDPNGAALTDIVRLFTDEEFQKTKTKHVTNPIVRSFWEHQMAQTGQREKQEMIPYFAAKFGQFISNTMMRNIIGQTKSAFNFFDVMQEGKILLMNLSKGSVGEINSKLLGLIIVQKIQMAAMKRQDVAKDQRRDFFLYIDEFQNYVTESIESILSEARKYRLGLVIAHQYLAQLEDDKGGMKQGQSKVKDAVFGNIGTMMSYKIGAQDAEHMAKEMAPVFSEQDLINIDKYKSVMKLSIDTQPSRPFSVVPINPYTEEGDKQAAEAYKQLSRLKYGRDRDFVEKEIIRRIGADI